MQSNLNVIVSTSDNYLHILPTFCFLFNKFWGAEQLVNIYGYKFPSFKLPSNFTFISMGVQTNKQDFGTDLRKVFLEQSSNFVWMMEDTFLTDYVNEKTFKLCEELTADATIGRIALSEYSHQQYTEHLGEFEDEKIEVMALPKDSIYKYSTQIAIWNKDYILKYLQDKMNPWEFECQTPVVDEFEVVSLKQENCPIKHNEGVRVWDINDFNLVGIDRGIIQEMKELKLFDNVKVTI